MQPVIEIKDADVIKAFVDAAKEQKQMKPVSSVLGEIVNDYALTPERQAMLEAVQEQELFDYFRKGRPQAISTIVRCCFGVASGDFTHPLIKRVGAAVKRLLAEDEVINRIRLYDSLVYLKLAEPPPPL